MRDKPGAAGRPIPVCRVRLVDDYDREVPAGTPGEIVVRGPVVFQGYFGQPDVTAYTLRNGWHHTGDVGRFDDEGWLYYVKRKPGKELIKPGGENVYPAEVESVIVQMDGIGAACVYGIPDRQVGRVDQGGRRSAAGRPLYRSTSHRLRGLEDRAVQAPACGRVHRRAAPDRRRRRGPRSGEGPVGHRSVKVESSSNSPA